MSQSNTLLSSAQSEEIYSQLSELYRSDISLTERLFRCRQILENLYKILTGNTNIAFTGLYGRMQYVQEVFAMPTVLVEQTQFIRLLTNKVVHKDDFTFSESDFVSSIKILAEAVNTFSNKKIPSEIDKYLTKNNAKYLGALRSPVHSKIDNMFGMVTAWKCSNEKESNRYIEINCQTTDGSEISITLWEKKEDYNIGRKWNLLDKVLWKYCNISFYNLSLVHGMTNRFQSTPQTLVVIEQDFLVDVSTVADCFQNQDCYPELFLMNKFFCEPLTPALAKGKCVNYVFDELINDPQKDLKVIFSEYLKQSPLALFSLGKEAWQEIYKIIEQDHYPQLRKVASDLQDKACQLEPSFIALKYGLHGRLDAMVLPTEELPKYSIIELKSGNPPKRDVWKAHHMQVVGYNMILCEIFGAAKIASSSILYSRSMQTPQRHVVNHITAEQDFLMCRNRIIGIMQKMATTPELVINWMKSSLRQYCNEFITEKAAHIYTVLNALDESEYYWFVDKIKFIFREIWAVKTGAFVESDTASFGFSSLWNCSLVEKKKQYRIIDGLWIEAVERDVITFHRTDDATLSNFRVGDIIVMYKQDVSVSEQQLIRGTISIINDEIIEIKTHSKLRAEGIFDKYTLWAIEPDLMESSLYNGLSSLFSFLCADPSERSILLGCSAPRFAEKEVPDVISWRNDVSECLQGMISARDYYLVQGPPGTGKTSCLLMQYIAYIKSETNQKVLIISFTNRAVDEICTHLDAENIEYTRIGTGNQLTKTNGIVNGQNGNAKTPLEKPGIDYDKARIFVSTLHSFLAVSADLLHKVTIDELVIDEASQLMEHQVIGLMSKINKSILIGDQNQLPPIILQNTDNDRVSILERMISGADKKIFPKCYNMLANHYRMHVDIAQLVSHNYQNKLTAGSKKQAAHHPWLKTSNKQLADIFKARIVWIDVQPSSQSKADVLQANWIKNFIDLLCHEMHADEIVNKVGIITPFRAQAQCIITSLGKKYKELTVDTVERFQGSQRDCIIMSYPIRYKYELNMLQSINNIGTIDRKLNVAISRAKEQLIIIGNSRILAHSEFYHKVYNLIKEKGVVICGNSLSDN